MVRPPSAVGGGGHHVQVVLNDQEGRAVVHERVEQLEQARHVAVGADSQVLFTAAW